MAGHSSAINTAGFADLQQLPGGACNFRELDRGTKTPVCGCKRFWLDTKHDTQNTWCFCGHHACFHNAISQQSQRLSNQSLATSHHASQSVRHTPEGYVSVQRMNAPAGLGIQPTQSQSINTRVWNALNGFARQQECGYSDLSSTAVSVNGDAGVMPPPAFVPRLTQPIIDEYAGSATEVATPSIAGTPDPQAFLPPETRTKLSPTTKLPDSGHATQLSSQVPSSEILNLLRAHSNRLEALEGFSFSHVPVDEIQEKLEIFDSRLLDVEQWRQETKEQASLEKEVKRERRLLPAEACSFASDESFDISAAANAEAAVLATIATSAEIGPRIEELELRVAELEKASLPSYARPWEIQVVLLPWGRALQGIWYSSTEQQNTHASLADVDEWTGALSQVKTSFSSEAWTTASIQAWADNARDWMSPKACGPAGSVFQRLASRGLVRDVQFVASDSRHVMDVLVNAFHHILVPQACKSNAGEQYQGLRSTFLPLRKVRKSTRLRYLSHAEMVTSASWTASFLESSVFMKVGDGQRRLYVTTPQAYIQSGSEGVTWQYIKQLAPRDANGEEHAGQIDDSIAIEACWTYSTKLDHVPSLHSSFASQSVWSTKSQLSNDGQLTPALSADHHKRTASLPSSASAREQMREVLAKRRVASFDPSTQLADATSQKRRRLSTSTEAERRGPNFTPRYSREPPSPFEAEASSDMLNQNMNTIKRGGTPFAYATPHSNVHFTHAAEIANDGDTERNSEGFPIQDDDAEEWNGMEGANIDFNKNTFDTNDDDDEDDDDMDEDISPQG